MSFAHVNSRPSRTKLFGSGRPQPLDREAKSRIMHLARALMRRAEKGKAYGPITAKALAVLHALLWGFHNGKSGLCHPSYETIAERAGCARSTVAEALKSLEAAGLLTWVHRIVRVKEGCVDLFGRMGSRVRVIRTSNGYAFNDPHPGAQTAGLAGNSSKSDFPSGTSNQPLPSVFVAPVAREIDPTTPLGAALLRCRAARERRMQPT